MANIPDDLHYSKDHEWVRVDGNVAIVGITDYAQDSLGDVVYVELPKVGDDFAANESFGSVESVKAVSEGFSPVSGEVVGINETLPQPYPRLSCWPVLSNLRLAIPEPGALVSSEPELISITFPQS